LGGTFGEPELTGDAQVDSGRIIFPFGTLKVDQAYASLSGNDPRGPELLIHATGRNYRYDVRLEVNGPAEDAQLTLSSTPPLNSEQILLMLTAGELPRDETTFSTQARAGRLATFLGRDIVSRFAGGDLAGERLIINTGENISEEGKTTYSIEYRLTDRWSIIGEYDRFSALNAGVKWKVYSR
jgi:translocation and assembly module TamB